MDIPALASRIEAVTVYSCGAAVTRVADLAPAGGAWPAQVRLAGAEDFYAGYDREAFPEEEEEEVVEEEALEEEPVSDRSRSWRATCRRASTT